MAAHSDTVTVADAAQTLGVSERTVWRYLKSGRLLGETVGAPGAQRTLIPRLRVDALLSTRGGADADALRAERDRLAVELAAANAARAALSDRVSMLQRALARAAAPTLGERIAGGALSALTRARTTRSPARPPFSA